MSTDQPPHTGSHSSRMRVLTLNLWQRFGAWSDRRAVLIDGLRALNPDLVAFHESIKTDEYDQTTDLLGSEFNVVHGTLHRTSRADPSGVISSEIISSRWTTRAGTHCGGPNAP